MRLLDLFGKAVVNRRDSAGPQIRDDSLHDRVAVALKKVNARHAGTLKKLAG